MQELVLVQPGRTVGDELEHEAARADARREFEERLGECGPLAYRVARGVLRNTADAEDVAQEAMLRAYRRFDRLRDRTRFRAWLVRIAFRLALVLAAMEGHTIEEIAGMLGISTGTVKSRIFYARRQLAEKLRCHANIIKKR